jgi:ABC-type branched-subunit amino acid transport system ATPase component
MSGAPILGVTGLTAGYGRTVVLRDVSLALQPAEILAVLGKNGMGKSTLLKTIMGFLVPMEGRVTLSGRDVTGQPPHLNTRAGVAYAPQEFTIFQDLSVEENLRLGVQDDATFRERVDMLGEHFPRMLERSRQRAGTLSGGEQKMLIMSRALLAQPRIMLIDEVSEGLQPLMISRMAEVLTRVRESLGTSILIVEQHLAFALSVADRYAVLKLGEIVAEGAAGDPSAAGLLAEHMKV